MSREVSLTTREAVHAPEMDDAFLVLLTIDHADLAEPIRVCNNSVNVTSNGNIYYAYPFALELPQQTDDRAPTARLQIDNVHRDIVAAVRIMSSPPAVTMQVVRASAPDTVEAEFPDFQMRDISYNSLTVEGELTLEQFVAEPYPAPVFSPAEFPGLF